MIFHDFPEFLEFPDLAVHDIRFCVQYNHRVLYRVLINSIGGELEEIPVLSTRPRPSVILSLVMELEIDNVTRIVFHLYQEPSMNCTLKMQIMHFLNKFICKILPH